ncbi:MAG TPA: hypothetical protein P5079_08790, partial [Elusimicrobiota bacterium]|nr:hypothetical protein [Elusimicrobiota bacterium]
IWPQPYVYYLNLRSTDSASNFETTFSTRVFRIDRNPPVAGLTQPANASGFSLLTTISGTAGGNERGDMEFSGIDVSSISLQIYDVTDPHYFNGANFNNTTPQTLFAEVYVGDSSGTWFYQSPNLDSAVNGFQSGHLYRITSWATDKAGNTQTTYVSGVSSNTFYFDNIKPSAGVLIPQQGKPYKSMPTLTGTATDDFSGVAEVQLNVNYLLAGDTWYWTGVDFTSGAYYTAGVSVTNSSAQVTGWTYNPSALNTKLVSRREYRAYALARDVANNWQAVSATNTFLFDVDWGTATVTLPETDGVIKSTYAPHQATQIQGVAVEMPSHAFAGIERVEIGIRRMPENTYWNGSSWVSSTWVVVNGSETWNYDEPDNPGWENDHLYYVYSRVLDLAGNLSPATTRSFYFDTAQPQSFLIDPNDAFETSLAVLTGTARDTPGTNYTEAGLKDVKVAIQINPGGIGNNWWNGSSGFTIDDGDFSDTGDTGWISASTDVAGNWILTGASTPTWVNNTKYLVKVRSQDNVNNLSLPVTSMTFVFDNSSPTASVTFPVTGSTRSVVSAIQGTAADVPAVSGKVRIATVTVTVQQAGGDYFNGSIFTSGGPFDLDAVFTGYSSGTWSYDTATLVSKLDSGNEYIVRAKAKDATGLVGPESSPVTFLWDVVRPTTTVTEPSYAGASKYYNTLPTLSGGVSDGPFEGKAAGIADKSQIEVAVYDKTANQWWNGTSGYQPGKNWVQASTYVAGAWQAYFSARVPAPPLTEGNTYLVQSRAKDSAAPANQGPPPNGADPADFVLGVDSVTFIVDKTPPVSKMVRPASGVENVMNAAALVTLSGTVTDALAGFGSTPYEDNVTVSIQEYDPVGLWWNGAFGGASTFTDTSENFYPVSSVNNNAVTVTTWTVAAPNLRHGYKYLIRVKSLDQTLPAPNVETTLSSATVRYDIKAPTATLAVPSLTVLNSLAEITGTVQEEFGVAGVSVTIRSTDAANSWWNGADFAGASAQYANATGLGTWVWDPGDTLRGKLVSGRQYEINVFARDVAGNVQAVTTKKTFTWDVTKPDSFATHPANNSYFMVGGLTLISGTAKDIIPVNAAVPELRVYLWEDDGDGEKETNDNPPLVYGDRWWNGSTWSTTETPLVPSVTPGASDPWPWQLNTNLPGPNDMRNGWKHYIYSRAVDNAGNEEDLPANGGTSDRLFYFDNQAPATLTQQPSEGQVINELTMVSGTASDNLNTKRVDIRIKDINDRYWDTSISNWRPLGSPGYPEIWNVATSSSSSPGAFTWTFTQVPNPWPNGATRIEVRAYDEAGNYAASYSTRNFTFDASRPLSVTTMPWTTDILFSSFSVFAGTATDDLGGVPDNGISNVTLRIKRLPDGDYWYNSGSWLPGENWVLASGAGSGLDVPFTYTHAKFTDGSAWDTGKTYEVVSKAQDGAGNVQVVFTTHSFIIDKSSPTTDTTNPPNTAAAIDEYYSDVKQLTLITGTAADAPAGVNKVYVSIYEEDTNQFFNGNTFGAATEYWHPATVYPSTWTFSDPDLQDRFYTGRTYRVRAYGVDNIGNIESTATIAGNRFLHDEVEPLSAVTSPPPGASREPTLNFLQGTAADGLSGVDRVQFAVIIDWDDSGGLAPTAGDYYYDPAVFSGITNSSFSWPVGTDKWIDADNTNWDYGFRDHGAQWVSGKSYLIKSRTIDRSENTEKTGDITYSSFTIAKAAHHFKVIPQNTVFTAGTQQTIRVVAQAVDNSTAIAYVGQVAFEAVGGPEKAGSDIFQDGLPQDYRFEAGDMGEKDFTIRLRRAGSRVINAWDPDGALEEPLVDTGTVNVSVNPEAADRVQVLMPNQIPAPGTVTGSTGTLATQTAGQNFVVTVRVTDQFYNLTLSSSPLVTLTMNDPFGSMVPNSFTASSQTIQTIFQTAGAANRTVCATVTPLNSSTSSAITVNPYNPVNLQVLVPGETAVPGSTASGGKGKAGLPDSDGGQSGAQPFVAGTTVTVTVNVTDAYWNLVPTVN